MGDRTIRIKESTITKRTYTDEEYTPEAIREIWSGETAQTCLVLALLERWEDAERSADQARAALDDANRDCVGLRVERDALRSHLARALARWVPDDRVGEGLWDQCNELLGNRDAAQEGK